MWWHFGWTEQPRMKNQDSHPKRVAVPELMVSTRIVEAETLRFHSRLRVLHGVEFGGCESAT